MVESAADRSPNLPHVLSLLKNVQIRVKKNSIKKCTASNYRKLATGRRGVTARGSGKMA
jgi:hypothetical protein